MSQQEGRQDSLSRRQFIRGCAAAAVLTSVPVLHSWDAYASPHSRNTRAAHRALSLDQDWLFGGKFNADALEAAFPDAAFSNVTLPHCVAPLSWRNWDPVSWEDVWIYRRHFALPKEFRGLRTFLHFDRVMAGATPVINGQRLPQHLGGFLPFEHEITDLAKQKNVLTVAVDSRWLDVPPEGSPRGPISVDYLLPGGISGSVSLRAVPSIFIRDVFAKPVDVLQPNRRVEIKCTVDAGTALPASVRLVATLKDGAREVASVSQNATIETASQDVSLTLSKLGNITMWHVDRPHLYDLVVTLFVDYKPLHDYSTRLGFREARFEVDGFFLNGERFRIFGLNRHELYPYVGFSASHRALRRDAEILRRDFNCNTVRCSHYPQSEAFLDACDELGLMVWEETPGWQYLGGEAFQKLVMQNVEDMVRRDRNHPSIVIWGVRVNESHNDPALYAQTREIAKALDGSRPTSGSMTMGSEKTWKTAWHQDVFAFDDYHSAPDGSVGIRKPLPGVPYLIAEAVGQFNYGGKGFKRTYRRAGEAATQQQQALVHAQAHSKAAEYSRCAGLIAWCAFDYFSLLNAYEAVKYPGVADVFRNPKLGASFYMAQVDPSIRPVIEPNFSWDFGPHEPSGPGERAAIFSNCDRLEISINGKPHSVLHPDRAGYPNLKAPPFFANLQMDGSGRPELRIEGYQNGAKVLSRSFSCDHSADQFWLHADDAELRADGADSTRLAFGAADKFGSLRTTGAGEVSLSIKGPGVIVGDNPFRLEDCGGVGAVWVKTVPGRSGQIRIDATHSVLGRKSVVIEARV